MPGSIISRTSDWLLPGPDLRQPPHTWCDLEAHCSARASCRPSRASHGPGSPMRYVERGPEAQPHGQACQDSNRRQLGLRLIDSASALCAGLPGPLSRSRALAREPGRRPGPEPGHRLQGGPPWAQARGQPAAWVSCPVGTLRSGRLQVGLGMSRTARGDIVPCCQTMSTTCA